MGDEDSSFIAPRVSDKIRNVCFVVSSDLFLSFQHVFEKLLCEKIEYFLSLKMKDDER